MTTTTITKLATAIKLGRFFSLELSYNNSDCNDKLYKKSELQNRVTISKKISSLRFCNYEHLKDVEEMRNLGKEAQKPTWWEWVTFPYIARHKTKGTLYLVCKTSKNTRSKSSYFLDGKETPYAAIANDFKKVSHNRSLVVMLRIDNVKSIIQKG